MLSRTNENLVYLANKSGWVRVVSGVNINGSADLAKNYILFGGTSAYKRSQNYSLREGIEPNGAYAMLGNEEVSRFGYRPMPGINTVKIQVQGKLGSLRLATVDFKAHDKMQLDVIDELYFRLGYSMFVEWGNTFFYKSSTQTLASGEDYCIDPFSQNLTKEQLQSKINNAVMMSEGNYDAMLGIVTNFSFSSDGNGGYNCTLRIMGLGVLGESIKLNNSTVLPGFVKDQIKQLVSSNAQNVYDLNVRSEVSKTGKNYNEERDKLLKEQAELKDYIDGANQGIKIATLLLAGFNKELSAYSTVPQPSDANYSAYQTSLTGKQNQEGAINIYQNAIKEKQGQLDAINLELKNYPTVEETVQQKTQTFQADESGKYNSSIEYMLRSIQLQSFIKAQKKINSLRSSTAQWSELVVVPYQIESDILNKIFEQGVYSKFVASGNGEGPEAYGYARAYLMAASPEELDIVKSTIGKLKKEEILKSYIVTYKQNQDLYEGAMLNYPCYIPLSFFMMMLNHCCLLYENDNSSGASSTPAVYVDFHPLTNVCLSNPQILSTNPYNFLIPFEGSEAAYRAIFNQSVLKGNTFNTTPAAEEEIWARSSEDMISDKIPPFRAYGDSSPYRGHFMNALVSVDYLLRTIKKYVTEDENNSIYLKNLLEQIVSDLNKSLGSFNSIRLAYSDQANCFYFSDDQAIKGGASQTTDNSSFEMPLYGKDSIAEKLDFKTDLSTKLSSMIAISARADAERQASAGVDASSLGKNNSRYQDRYKKNIASINDSGAANGSPGAFTAAAAAAAYQFNHTIRAFYGVGINSEDKVGQATNYFIDRMAKAKASNLATQSSTVIPIVLSFTVDGISGMFMGQAFTVSENLLPSNYSNIGGNKKVGFIITGVDHIIEGNRWKSEVKSQMYWLRNASVYNVAPGQGLTPVSQNKPTRVRGDYSQEAQPDLFSLPPSEGGLPAGGQGYFTPKKITDAEKKANESQVAQYLKDKGLKDYQIAAVMGHLSHESSFNPGALNPNDKGKRSVGIAQWRGERDAALSARPDSGTLKGQLDFLWSEFQTRPAGKRLLASSNYNDAFNAMAGFEAYEGYNDKSSSSYQKRLSTSTYYLNTYLKRG